MRNGSLNARKLMKITTIAVFGLSLVAIGLTLLFIRNTLNRVASPAASTARAPAVPRTLDIKLLDKLSERIAARTSRSPIDLAGRRDPFLAAPTPPSAPAQEPSPPPAEPTPPVPPPAPTTPTP